ncbi:MAG: precorrin-2 C(20)-methyltransferase [Desulfovibrio sp.]|nr:precorrin-2 C(20)-methyltransferase [Desulfovibrio sp.]
MRKLYGIGVGPGDPELLTLRAARVLNEVDRVFAAASSSNEESAALEIARPHIRREIPISRLDFPMVRNRETLETAWEKAAVYVRDNIAPDQTAAFLTLGDPLIYSTFAYLARSLAKIDPSLEIEIIPGITSFQAAAAYLKTSLCEGDEALCVLAGTASRDTLKDFLALPASAAILKVYRNYANIRAALSDTNREKDAILLSRVAREGERARPLLEESERPPYMSLIISKKND